MSFIYVCNTGSDYISRIDVEGFKEELKIYLNEVKGIKSGPHDIFLYKDRLFVTNCYSNTLSIIHKDSSKVEESFFIGAHCNGVVVENNIAYIVCGELNNVILFDLKKKKVIEAIPCGVSPHSITFDHEKGYVVICNMESNSITIIDCVNRQEVKTIPVGNYPTKAIFSSDNKYILVCESNLQSEKRGWIGIVSLKDGKLIYRIPVGKYPIDICSRGDQYVVSNFGEGSISIIDLNSSKEEKKIYVGGMPRGLICNRQYIYIGDSYGNTLIRLDPAKLNKKVIAIGKEPTGMTLVTH